MPQLCTLLVKVPAHRRFRKSIDETNRLRCRNGTIGALREEVYVDASGTVVKYNLAFVNLTLCPWDNGRVLGYDNSHDRHERHFMGSVQEVAFDSYAETLQRFLGEVAILKETA